MKQSTIIIFTSKCVIYNPILYTLKSGKNGGGKKVS